MEATDGFVGGFVGGSSMIFLKPVILLWWYICRFHSPIVDILSF